MKTIVMAVLAALALLVTADPLFAQAAPLGQATHTFSEFSYGYAAAGFGVGLAIIGAGIGFGRIGGSALESMARQPEVAGRVFTGMLIIGALLEGATFFGLAICIIMALK
jgi:F-type H+-transporting ATPase subunit c